MDKFKEKTMLDYTSWDMNCKCVKFNAKNKKKLKNLFKRKARRKLKRCIEDENQM